MKRIDKIKKKIIEGLEGKKIIQVNTNFKTSLEIFWVGWEYTRKFPDYHLKKELKNLFFPPKLECLLK